MLTIILPGFSIHNKEWAEQASRHLPSSIVHEWKHWKTRKKSDFNAKNEAKVVISKIDSDVNILAKSAGTIVAMYILKMNPERISKIILCGIPINWDNMDSVSRESYEILKDFPADKIKILQNTDDPYANYKLVKENIEKINSRIEVVEKLRKDHEYWFFEDFVNFLE